MLGFVVGTMLVAVVGWLGLRVGLSVGERSLQGQLARAPERFPISSSEFQKWPLTQEMAWPFTDDRGEL
jgi:hypothetical protein